MAKVFAGEAVVPAIFGAEATIPVAGEVLMGATAAVLFPIMIAKKVRRNRE